MKAILEEKKYSVREAARFCEVDPRTMRLYIEKRLISFYRLGGSGKMLIPESELVKFLEKNFNTTK